MLDSIMKSFDNLFTSDEERLEAKSKLVTILSDYDKQTSKLNLLDARGNWMQRSWRPLLAMVCVVIFAYGNLIAPVFHTQAIDMTKAHEMLYYLLGYSGLRTFEKIKGVK